MRKLLALTLALFPAAALANASLGEQIFLHGNSNGALPCAACHGLAAQGNTAIGAPKLGGVPAAAIETDLAMFANGEGGNANMQYIAQALSPAETQAVASYLANLPKSNPPAAPTN